jgi:hypothetical protein
MRRRSPGSLMSGRSRRGGDPGLAIGVATTLLGFLLLAGPASAADPLLPSLPVALPTLPLPTLPPPPTLPLPTLPPPPTLPLPTLPPPPTLPLPTPTLRLPTPTLPLSTPTPTPTPRATSAPATPTPPASPSPPSSAAPSLGGVGPGSSGTSEEGPIDARPVAATGVPSEPLPVIVDGGSLFDSLGLPGLILGIPAIIIIGILVAQLAVGAAWLPVIRRWLNRRV